MTTDTACPAGGSYVAVPCIQRASAHMMDVARETTVRHDHPVDDQLAECPRRRDPQSPSTPTVPKELGRRSSFRACHPREPGAGPKPPYDAVAFEGKSAARATVRTVSVNFPITGWDCSACAETSSWPSTAFPCIDLSLSACRRHGAGTPGEEDSQAKPGREARVPSLEAAPRKRHHRWRCGSVGKPATACWSAALDAAPEALTSGLAAVGARPVPGSLKQAEEGRRELRGSPAGINRVDRRPLLQTSRSRTVRIAVDHSPPAPTFVLVGR